MQTKRNTEVELVKIVGFLRLLKNKYCKNTDSNSIATQASVLHT